MTVSDDQAAASTTTLTPEVLAYLAGVGVELAASAGETVVRRGEPGRAFWAVLDGTVEVRLTGEDDRHLPLARLGTGSTFGEMALVTGNPVSADVVALTAVRLLRYPAESFARALGECAPLRTLVLARMAANLRDTSTDVWKFYQQAKALNVLMGPQRQAGPVVAESGVMKLVRQQIALRSQDAEPVLVTGDPGTGKLFVTAKIHEATGQADAPFIAVDCRRLDAAEAMRFLVGSEKALEPAGADDSAALRRYGALQLAHGGTLVLRHVDELPPPAQEAFGRYVQERRAGRLSYPATRIAATNDLSPTNFAARIAPSLADGFDGHSIVVPRLHERRRDIVPLARLFLAARQPAAARSLSRSAEHILLSQRYTHRNAAELREAIEMAVVISDEPSIQAEHIFTGPKGEGTVQEIDLTGFAFVRRLTSHRVLVALRVVVFAMFATIVASSLFRSAAPAGAIANSATWGLWEPGLFVVFLLVGRVWCTVCPLSTAGRIAARLKCLELTPGCWHWLRAADDGVIPTNDSAMTSSASVIVLVARCANGGRDAPSSRGVLPPSRRRSRC